MARKTKYAGVPGLETEPRRRPSRVADLIQNEIAMLLLGKIKDPRVGNVTITGVRVTNDLRLAQIFFSVFGDEDLAEVKKGLASAKGFIRSHLARQLNLRYMPDLEFREDSALKQQERMEKIFQEIHDEHDKSSS